MNRRRPSALPGSENRAKLPVCPRANKPLGQAGAGIDLGYQVRLAYVFPVSERIIVDADVCSGKPVVRGTRITVQTVLEFLAEGVSVSDVLEEYPSLGKEDVNACLDYASRVMGNQFSTVAVT